jgi:hypothetical protein
MDFNNNNTTMTENSIKEVVAEYFHLEESDLSIPSRECKLVEARHIAMSLCREFTSLSFGRIGQAFNRDHASVMHAMKAVSNQIETNQKYAKQFEKIKELLLRFELTNTNEDVFMENDFYKPEVKEPAKPIKPCKPINMSKYVCPFKDIPVKTHEFSGYRVHSL